MAKPETLSDETTLPDPDADKQPQHVIEYATPASINPDEKGAFVLGLVAVSLAIFLLIFIIGVVLTVVLSDSRDT